MRAKGWRTVVVGVCVAMGAGRLGGPSFGFSGKTFSYDVTRTDYDYYPNGRVKKCTTVRDSCTGSEAHVNAARAAFLALKLKKLGTPGIAGPNSMSATDPSTGTPIVLQNGPAVFVEDSSLITTLNLTDTNPNPVLRPGTTHEWHAFRADTVTSGQADCAFYYNITATWTSDTTGPTAGDTNVAYLGHIATNGETVVPAIKQGIIPAVTPVPALSKIGVIALNAVLLSLALWMLWLRNRNLTAQD